MRNEFTEYNFDWTLNSIFAMASKMGDCTEKEFTRVLARTKNEAEMIEYLFSHGEPGKLFLQGFSYYLNSIMTAHEQGKKLCLTTFCQSPAIFYAFDIIPITAEVITVAGTMLRKNGTAPFMDFCLEVGFTETSCSSQRGSMGAYLSGLAIKPDMAAIDTPGICDTNANAFAFAAQYLDIPFFQLNYPPTLKDEKAKEYHRQDYYHLIAFLEEQTGKKLDEDRLREILLETKKQDALICEIQELQRLVPSPVPVLYNLFIYAGPFIMRGLPVCTMLLESMQKVVKDNAGHGRSGLTSGVEKKRCLMVYIEHYAASIPLWRFLNDNGITHLGGILSRFYQENVFYSQGDGFKIKTATLDEMIDSMAQMNARLPMVKQIRGPYDAPGMWRDEALFLSEALSADFAIYSGTPGCRNTWGMVKLFAKDMEESGLPIFVISSDAFDERVESWQATQNRLEEFLDLRNLN